MTKNVYPELPEIPYKKTKIDMPTMVVFAKSLIGKYPIEIVRMAYIIFRNESANGKSGVNNNYIGLQADNAVWQGVDLNNVVGTSVKMDGAGDTRRFICFNDNGYKTCFDFLCYKIQQRKITDYRSYQDHWVSNPKEDTPEAESDFHSLMSSAMKAFVILLFILFSNVGKSQTCPPEGDNKKEVNDNLLKNRQWFPDKNKAKGYSFDLMMKDGIKDTGAIYVDAYITSAKISGLESCECHIADKSFQDYHIFISADPKDKLGKHNQVVEVSRYARSFNKSITFEYVKLLVGHKVRIYGYTFIDEEHKNVIGSKNQWRAGLQEIHPVFFIMKLD